MLSLYIFRGRQSLNAKILFRFVPKQALLHSADVPAHRNRGCSPGTHKTPVSWFIGYTNLAHK
jgi:hypothetical protein